MAPLRELAFGSAIVLFIILKPLSKEFTNSPPKKSFPNQKSANTVTNKWSSKTPKQVKLPTDHHPPSKSHTSLPI